MENNDAARWVDLRIAQLPALDEWQPDVSRAFARFDKRRSRTRRWRIALAVATASCTFSLAFPTPRAAAQRCVDACSVLFQRKIDAQSARPLAPDFTVKDSAGADLRLSDYKGKVVLLNFWATNCGPCRVEIPWLIEFDRTYRDQGFAVVGISMDEDGWSAIRSFMIEKKINYRIGLGDDAVAQKYGGLDAIPVSVLLDRRNRIASTHVGLIPKAAWEQEIPRILAEKK